MIRTVGQCSHIRKEREATPSQEERRLPDACGPCVSLDGLSQRQRGSVWGDWGQSHRAETNVGASSPPEQNQPLSPAELLTKK